MRAKHTEQPETPRPPARPWWKRATRWLAGSSALVLANVTSRLPAVVGRFLGELSGRLLYYLAPRKRRRAEHNLEMILGEDLTARQRRQMTNRMMIGWGRNVMAALHGLRLSPQKLENLVSIQGEECLREALAHGRGVIALSVHLGPFPLMAARLAAEGYPYHVPVRATSDPRLAAYFERLLAKWGIVSYDHRWDVRRLIHALRKGAILHLLIDQHPTRGGIEALFLGQPTHMPRGPAVFARLTGAPVLPIFMVSSRPGHYVIHIEEPLPVVNTGDKHRDDVVNTQTFADCVGQMIRRFPEHWFLWTQSLWR